LRRVILRPWPAVVSLPDVLLLGRWRHRRRSGDRMRIYYNQPLRCSNYLVLKYAESTSRTSMATLTRALGALDAVARLKRSDALLCDASNPRITVRAMRRFGWEPHCPSRFHRHFIKRFYGTFRETY
jgi:hypothetical protein